MSESSMITRMGVNLLIRQTKSEPFIRQTAKEFMFGYESALVTIGNKFLPSWIVFDKLGLIDRVSFLYNNIQGNIFRSPLGDNILTQKQIFTLLSYNQV